LLAARAGLAWLVDGGGEVGVDEVLIGEGPVLLEINKVGVERVRLNRPGAAGGMNVELLRALHEAIMRCHGDPRVRVVVLSGAGKNFCAGGDVRTFASKGAALPDYLREATSWLQLATAALVQLGPPVIAQVQGVVTEVAPDGELPARVDGLAAELARCAPLALAATKRLVWAGVRATLAERLPEEARTVSELSGSADAREGLAAVIERRAPEFTGS
jgi:enoyl-CoA hydratase/carnithine racemase